MTAAMDNATVVSTFASYYNKLKVFRKLPVSRNVEVQSLVNDLAASIGVCLAAISTDNAYTVNFTEPRYTIVTPFSGVTRLYKAKAGSSISLTFTTSDGELNSTAVWSLIDAPSWLSINSSTGELTGTTPALSQSTFNFLTGNETPNTYDVLHPFKISCINDFGEAINGPLEFTIQVVDSGTSVVSSSATGTGATGGALTTYTVAASNSPASFKAYDLSVLNGVDGTITINPTTGAITGNVGSDLVDGTYVIYVCAINAKGEGIDKAVTITLS